ncbi:hypothetical protein GW750_08840 [bacterium]|nr:hypothetical protein [bacterium]
MLPTLCPEERQRLRLLFRNEKNLYKRKCDATGKDILSVYEQNSPYKVYDKSYRRSDKRSALDFGQTFDFSKTFTENMDTLIKNVPIYNIQHNKPCENSDYCNIVAEVRNGYMSSS